ncbi:SRPBCC family protein [Salinicoccus halodurans]|uniref:Ribosome association toxin PasT (RatA) of the RatAB toxin-antitoxin module n=1 Tax=Salinicoccus halodurans TaxID=407035 RepID=A0A0F7HL82_9STAP|nr:SRPBCC family protein [Salinicoccus halodurans]AKG74671.1 hypothetical protein AAT16_10990 [Salinicoccus halodurans]SFK88646.1 Ribosome association toxin PasT (RatA) of the RatAB toxin-antitoxin module [Salinicoccus halodurans]
MELYRYDRQMKASPEEIFDVVNDDEKLKQWSPIFEGNEYFTEEHRAKGTKFRTKLKVLNKTYQFRSQITEYEENRHVKVRTTLRQGIITSEFQLAPASNDETQVTVTSNFEGAGRKYNLILKGAKPVIKKVLDSQVNKLEQLAVK